jgi:plastocyanin
VTEVVLQRCEPGAGGVGDLETVLVEDFSFDPTAITIEEGGTVRWVWTADTPHTITSGAAGDAGSLFDESASEAGAVVEVVFDQQGSFPYFSNTETDVDEGMAGTVNVVGDDGLDDGNDADGEDSESQKGGLVTVYRGAFDVDVLDLTELSQVLSTVEIPADDYCKIRIRIQDPRLVLVEDPETVLTNVHLTANGRLFIEDHFALHDGDEVLVVVYFDGIHLVLAGHSGMYVLTPQLRANVEVTDAAVEIHGEIVSVDAETSVIEVRTPNVDVFEVSIREQTQIFSDDDSDDESEEDENGAVVALAFDDLVAGQNVTIRGLLTVTGETAADEVEIADGDIDTTL